MNTTSPIQALLRLGLHDSIIARRLQVSHVTVSRWRHGVSTPQDTHQTTALAFLGEIHRQTFEAITAAALTRSAA